jgi:Protein of unknown function (DUF3987)
MGSNLYPGLYVLLVGPPGIGKGQAMYQAERLLREVPEIHVGPSDLTAASLIDALNEATRNVILLNNPEPMVQFNSLIILSRELGVLLPMWEHALMNNLTDIYDGFSVDQKRRGKDLRIKIKSPQINLLGACTPSYLNEVLPAGAWDQGFISRTILIYSGDRISRDPFMEDSISGLTTRLYNDLLHDLKTIGAEFGQCSFTTPTAAAIRAWVTGGCKPEPEHTKLQFYNARRAAHLLKLCMVASLSRSGEKIISLEHYQEALDWLIEAETYMPDIFKSMVQGGDSSAMEEAWNYVWNVFSKNNKPVSSSLIIHFLRERVPAHSIEKVLEMMVKSNMLKITLEGGQFTGYRPSTRQERLSGGA